MARESCAVADCNKSGFHPVVTRTPEAEIAVLLCGQCNRMRIQGALLRLAVHDMIVYYQEKIKW